MSAKQKRRLKVLKLVKHVTQTYSRVDKEITDARAALPGIPCKRGCNACCRMHTIITAAEAFTIVEKHPELVRSRLPVLKEQAEIMTDLAKKYDNQTLKHEVVIGSDWWALQLACPLLLDDGSCGVYAVRPIACRTHMVVDDPARCAMVPAVYIAHCVPIQLRDGAYTEISDNWFADMRTHVYPFGSLPKMVLIAYNTLMGSGPLFSTRATKSTSEIPHEDAKDSSSEPDCE
jgi:Fe-S-cluster containining protein